MECGGDKKGFFALFSEDLESLKKGLIELKETKEDTLDFKNQAQEFATQAQLRAWEAEAMRKTAQSFATEDINNYVKIYTSNGDGTFSFIEVDKYSSLYWQTQAQLRAWEAEAMRKTAQSFATEDINNYVKIYTSNGDGTFSFTQVNSFSALHHKEHAQQIVNNEWGGIGGDSVDNQFDLSEELDAMTNEIIKNNAHRFKLHFNFI